MRNANLISHRGHYFDVITEEKVKASKKPKNHVPITKPKLILGQATQKRLILKTKTQKTWHFPLQLCFQVDSLQNGANTSIFIWSRQSM